MHLFERLYCRLNTSNENKIEHKFFERNIVIVWGLTNHSGETDTEMIGNAWLGDNLCPGILKHLDTITQRVYELIIEILKDAFCFYHGSNRPTRSHICICQDMCKVMIWSDKFCQIRAAATLIFTIVGLWTHYPFVKRAHPHQNPPFNADHIKHYV